MRSGAWQRRHEAAGRAGIRGGVVRQVGTIHLLALRPPDRRFRTGPAQCEAKGGALRPTAQGTAAATRLQQTQLMVSSAPPRAPQAPQKSALALTALCCSLLAHAAAAQQLVGSGTQFVAPRQAQLGSRRSLRGVSALDAPLGYSPLPYYSPSPAPYSPSPAPYRWAGVAGECCSGTGARGPPARSGATRQAVAASTACRSGQAGAALSSALNKAPLPSPPPAQPAHVLPSALQPAHGAPPAAAGLGPRPHL